MEPRLQGQRREHGDDTRGARVSPGQMKNPAESRDCSPDAPPSALIPAAPGTITLVRHGEPALSRKIRFNAKGYGEWWALYEEGGLKDVQSPPARALHLAARAGTVLVSTRRRSHESAAILAPGRDTVEDVLFIEAPLPPPPFPGWFRLSPKKWGFITRFCWYYFNHHAGGESRAQAWMRSDAAAERLIALAHQGEPVTLVAHGFFNVMIEKSLMRRGWTRTLHEGGYSYWAIRHFEKL
jgi:broad specificity phosphatase PhoE